MEYDETRVHHLGEGTPWPTAAPGDDVIASPPPAGRGRRLGTGIGLLVGGLLAGTIGVTAVQAATGSTKTEEPTAATGQAAPQTGLGGAPGAPPGGFAGRGGGGLDGEQRISATVAAVGASSVTVTTPNGRTTYAVTSTTDIRRDGQTIALSGLKVGEAVLLHVYPSGSSYAAERILAGTQDRGGFGGPPQTGTPQNT